MSLQGRLYFHQSESSLRAATHHILHSWICPGLSLAASTCWFVHVGQAAFIRTSRGQIHVVTCEPTRSGLPSKQSFWTSPTYQTLKEMHGSLAAVQELNCHTTRPDQKSATLNLIHSHKGHSLRLMQRRAPAYLSLTGSLTHRWARAAYDLPPCNNTEATELDKRLQLINGKTSDVKYLILPSPLA